MEEPKPFPWRRLFSLAVAAAILSAAVVAWIGHSHSAPELSFTYSLLVAMPGQPTRELSPNATLPIDASVKLKLISPSAGFLRVLADGKLVGSEEARANTPVILPLDQSGRPNIALIWSIAPIPSMDDALLARAPIPDETRYSTRTSVRGRGSMLVTHFTLARQ